MLRETGLNMNILGLFVSNKDGDWQFYKITILVASGEFRIFSQSELILLSSKNNERATFFLCHEI